MRTFLIFLAGLALIPSALATSTSSPSTLTLSVSSHRVLFGHGVTLSGKLTGDRRAGRAVTIAAWQYGRSAPRRVAVVHTNANGAWSFTARPKLQTAYQARAASSMSPRIVVGVAPAVAVHVLANGHLRVQLAAGRSFYGRFVELQRKATNGTWQTVGRKRLSSASIAVISPLLPQSTIRIAMSVNQAGVGYLGAASHALTYRPETLTMRPSTYKVLYGHHVALAGRLVNGRAGTHVTILARPYGRQIPVRVATVKVRRNGRYSLFVRPSIQTTYLARVGKGKAGPLVKVGVRPSMSIEQLASGAVRARVIAGSSLRGRMVQLQRLQGGTWKTLAKLPLRKNSTATFSSALRRSTIRVAMSVNQAGAGYLGTFSHPLRYRAA